MLSLARLAVSALLVSLMGAWTATAQDGPDQPTSAVAETGKRCGKSKPPADGDVPLSYPLFCASGDGDAVEIGTYDRETRSGKRILVPDGATWRRGHGVRIEQAGAARKLSVATLSPDRDSGAKCQLKGQSTSTNVELCVATLKAPTSFEGHDELLLRIRTDKPAARGDLQIILMDEDDGFAEKGVLDVPALKAGDWQWAGAGIQGLTERRYGQIVGGLERVIGFKLICRRNCVDRQVQLAEPQLSLDHVTKVSKVDRLEGGGAALTLEAMPRRRVDGSKVFHDDTAAVRAWLDVARRKGGARLTAPPGVYYLSNDAGFANDLRLFKDTAIACAGPDETVFRNSGKAQTGRARMFRSRVSEKDDIGLYPELEPDNISVRDCGFDLNGWNARDFLTVFTIYGDTQTQVFADNIRFENNYFYDSRSPGRYGCDLDQDFCRILQRQFIVVLVANDVVIANNRMRDGGRIKVGQPGNNIEVYGNTLDLVNDNGITFVDFQRDECRRIGRCVTQNIRIHNNRIKDAIGAGIFFGGDGEIKIGRDITVRDVEIYDNEITGYFHNGIKALFPPDVENIRIHNNRIIRTRARPDLNKIATRGILLRTYAGPAKNVTITDNLIAASGEHAAFNGGGVALRGKGFEGLTVTGNDIACDGCAYMENGVFMTAQGDALGGNDDAIYDRNVRISGNRIFQGATGMTLLRNFDGAEIKDNLLCRTREENGSALRLRADIRGRIEDNALVDGAGFGVECFGPTALRKALPLTRNYFDGNARGAYKNCPGPEKAAAAPPASAPSCAEAAEELSDLTIEPHPSFGVNR